MKNILISQTINKNLNNKLIYSVEKSWYDFFKKLNINLITLDLSKNIKKEKISAIILHGGGGNNLPKVLKFKRKYFKKKI